MNIEEIKDRVNITKNAFHKLGIEGQVNINVMLNDIEFLLTAYEKVKGENVKLRLQDIPLIEGELKAYKDRVNELKQELEKEKEKNKSLEQENKNLNVVRLQYLVSSFPDTTETYKKYKKELDEILKEE